MMVEIRRLETLPMNSLDSSISYNVWSRARTLTVHALPHELDQQWISSLLVVLVKGICNV